MRNYWSMNPDRLQRCLHERSPLAVRRVRQRDLVFRFTTFHVTFKSRYR
jgi:hypothetical protein